jgi:UDP-sugar transporter A1/2/3
VKSLTTKSITSTSHLAAISVPASFPSSQSLVAWWYLSLLAILFGTQPFFQKKYVPKTICRSSVVLAQEVTKVATAASLLWASGGWAKATASWSTQSWCVHALLPGCIYSLQNYCTLMAYQNLPPFTFNVLNQTKTLSAALCCYFVIGKPQSKFQVVALLLLLLSALVIERVIPITNKPDTRHYSKEQLFDRKTYLLSGVVPVLLASFLSGLAGALSQRSVQSTGRNAYLFTMELSVASCLFLITSLLLNSPDGRTIAEKGFFHGWTPTTIIPVLTKALGGVVVGLVTKHAGAVRKGFALIFGLLLSGILQSKGERVTSEQVAGGILAAISLWMHSRFPYVATT